MNGKSTLDDWIAGKLGIAPQAMTYNDIEAYQLAKLKETMIFARQHALFYRRHLAGIDVDKIHNKADLDSLPLTEQWALRNEPTEFLCIGLDKISRVLTLQTSGTTGVSKKIFFSEADMELTTDFFRWGMANLTRPGDNVLILMPGERPGSIGDLLTKALARFGCKAWCEWPPADSNLISRMILNRKINVIVGIPAWVRALALYWQKNMQGCRHHLKAILLSADRSGFVVRKTLRQIWNCPVFDHYGSSEMGYGGGVECGVRQGYHLREADLLFEIIDPVSGRRLGRDQVGEVVFSTLTREGMPLIRYRTGDLASISSQRCSCGSVLPVMSAIQGRVTDLIFIDGKALTALELDEVLLDFKEIADYSAYYDTGSRRFSIKATLCGNYPDIKDLMDKVKMRLGNLTVITYLLGTKGSLAVEIDRAVLALPGHMQKRTVFVEKTEEAR